MLGGGVVNSFRYAVSLAYVRSGFLGIDEVENGLYYHRLPEIFSALVQARKRIGTQLMLATHSDEALTALADAAMEHDPDQFAVVHLRREQDDSIRATVIKGRDAKSMRDHGYDLR
jgi:predicted ATPase